MFSAAYCKAHGQNEHKMQKKNNWEKFMLFKMVSTHQIHFVILKFLLTKLFQIENLNY
jgi:hypothetical protein